MKFICHIGHHKTGTSTLQAFLSQNSHRLMQAGTLYPWVETQGAAHALAKAMGAGDQQEILPINIREAHNALAFRMLSDALPNWKVPGYHHDLPHSRQMMLALSHQISAIQPETVVLCSEVMSHFGKIAPDQILRLRTEGLGAAEQFTLWCTLRRPDEQLVSWHGQQVRLGQSPTPLSSPNHELNMRSLHVDYRGVIEPWLQNIPGAECILRPYRETMAEGGSVQDFLAHAGFPTFEGLLSETTMNVSFKPAQIVLLRMANSQLPRAAAQYLINHIDVLTEGMTLASSAEVEMLGPVSRALLVASFTPVHDWLSRTTDRTAFFTDIEQMGVCHPMSECAALQQLLDQLSPTRIAEVAIPEAQEFLHLLHQSGAPA